MYALKEDKKRNNIINRRMKEIMKCYVVCLFQKFHFISLYAGVVFVAVSSMTISLF